MVLDPGLLVHAMVALIYWDIMQMYRLHGLDNVVEASRCATGCLQLPRISVPANVSVDPKVPLVGLLGLAQLGVALTSGALGATNFAPPYLLAH